MLVTSLVCRPRPTPSRPAHPPTKLDTVSVTRPVAPDLSYVSEAESLWQSDYFVARDRFRHYAAHFAGNHPGGVLGAIDVPSQTDTDLTVDYLVLPATERAENVLVISSGVHGAEGPTGSAMQELFFRENLARLDLSKTTLVMLHSVNPWGHVHNYRNDEFNVDPNRNNLMDPDGFDHYPNGEYELVRPIMEVTGPPAYTWLGTFLGVATGLVGSLFSVCFDVQRVVKAMAEGQTLDPRGPFYAGEDYIPQLGPIRDLLQAHLPGADRVIHFDIHTGLGESGVLHMINTSSEEHAQDFMRGMSGRYLKYTGRNSPGFYDNSLGDFSNNTRLATDDGAVHLAFTAEVGTLGNSTYDKVVTAFRLKERSQLHFYPDVSECKREAIENRYRGLFDPQERWWREQTVDNFREIWRRAVSYLRTPSSTSGLEGLR